jgi:hypothetical protein
MHSGQNFIVPSNPLPQIEQMRLPFDFMMRLIDVARDEGFRIRGNQPRIGLTLENDFSRLPGWHTVGSLEL